MGREGTRWGPGIGGQRGSDTKVPHTHSPLPYLMGTGPRQGGERHRVGIHPGFKIRPCGSGV